MSVGCEIGIQFPIVKLSEFAPFLNQLLRNENAFALVTVAHLLTQQTRKQPVKRLAAKWTLARLLYERQWSRQRVIDLFIVIDWIMSIPSDLQMRLMNDIRELERARSMPYMNSFEKYGVELGRRTAARTILTKLLEQRFGTLSSKSKDLLEQAETEQLIRWSTAIVGAASIEDVFKMH